MFSIHLPDEIQARLINLAERTGQPISHHVREAILAYLDDQEDLHQAEQRLIDVRSGRSRVYSLDEVVERLGVAVNRVDKGG